jgi:hypothetical protein
MKKVNTQQNKHMRNIFTDSSSLKGHQSAIRLELSLTGKFILQFGFDKFLTQHRAEKKSAKEKESIYLSGQTLSGSKNYN